jgi:TatA/E family protein of Tat protein translocase
MFGIGTQELILIIIIILLLFGSSKLPELSKGIGQAIRELKKGMSDESDSGAKKKKEDGSTKE